MKRDWLWIGACFGLGEVLYYTIRPVWIFLIPTILIIIAGVYLVKRISDSGNLRRAVIICSIAFFVGSGRMALAQVMPKMPSDEDALRVENIEIKNGKQVITAGHTLIYYKDHDADIRASDTDIKASDTDIKASAADIRIGNLIKVEGRFQENTRASNPGQFDFDTYYRAKGIYYSGFADSVEIVDRKVDYLKQFMYELRVKLSKRIMQVYNEYDAGFLIAALLGDKSNLDADMYDLYRRNGIAHLLAISGLHIAIIGMGVYRLLRKRLSVRASGIIAGAWIMLYTIFTGASVSTVRACIMLLITFLARDIGRKADMLNSAGLAATVILLISPYELYNCGMLLSFGAVIGIAAPAKELMRRLMPQGHIARGKHNASGPLILFITKAEEAFIVSFSVQLFTLPIMAYFFFEVSIYGVFLNLLVIPLMTCVVWSGIVSAAFTSILSVAAKAAALSGHYIISLYSWLCSLCDKLPWHTILIGRPKIWQIALYYSFLFAVLYWPRFRARIRRSLSWMSDRETGSI